MARSSRCAATATRCRERPTSIVGVLQVHPDGYGFVTPEHAAGAGDVYVSRAGLKDAMHGDRVAVRAVRQRGGERFEGRISRILDRGSGRVVGEVRMAGAGRVEVVPHERRLLQRISVPPGESRGAAAGDLVETEITRWPTATRGPVGRVTEVFGPIDAPGVDTTVILRTHGIAEEHGPAAVAEARWLGAEVRPADLEGRRDFRGESIVTIDGEDARDFDDAVSVEALPGGGYRLGVHIADVAHYVRPGSALDAEALERGTSVYFPDRAVHMFPAELATGLCSLREGADRLVQSCIMDVDARGSVAHYEFHDGVIRSRARLTYTEVNAILTRQDADAAAPRAALVPMLERMRGLYEILRERRRRRGLSTSTCPNPRSCSTKKGRWPRSPRWSETSRTA